MRPERFGASHAPAPIAIRLIAIALTAVSRCDFVMSCLAPEVGWPANRSTSGEPYPKTCAPASLPERPNRIAPGEASASEPDRVSGRLSCPFGHEPPPTHEPEITGSARQRERAALGACRCRRPLAAASLRLVVAAALRDRGARRGGAAEQPPGTPG